jgi:N6-L-threonylcarbamoyladenine synthase
VIAGGVSANVCLRTQLTALSQQEGFALYFPRFEFCTDNAAMIAYTGALRFLRGEKDGAETAIQPRWSLELLKN